MDSHTVGTGERLTFVNRSETATTYRAEFQGVGSVCFQVLPGAEFVVIGQAGGTINIHIDHLAAPGIRSADG